MPQGRLASLPVRYSVAWHCVLLKKSLLESLGTGFSCRSSPARLLPCWLLWHPGVSYPSHQEKSEPCYQRPSSVTSGQSRFRLWTIAFVTALAIGAFEVGYHSAARRSSLSMHIT